MGKNTERVAQKAAQIKDISSVIRLDGDHLEHLLAEDAAKIVEMLGNNYQVILAAHSWFSRNFLPRVAAVLNVSLITDVLKICLLYTSPSPRDAHESRMPSSA